MMTSNGSSKEAFVWIWLPQQTEPVVAGKLEAENGALLFNWIRRYFMAVQSVEPAPKH